MTKAVKIGIGIGALILIIALLWWIFGGKKDQWEEKPGGDIPGYDILSRSIGSNTLDDDKRKAAELGAKSFLRNPDSGMTHFKSVDSPISYTQGANWKLYVLKK